MKAPQYKQPSKTNSGFTLIELVLVIIILGILAATAVPKLFGRSSYEDYTVRDQLISRLRLVQLQGMNAGPSDADSDNFCYWLVVKSSCFYHEQTARSSNGSCSSPSASDVCSGDSFNRYNAVSFSDGMLGEANYRFNIDGTLADDDSASSQITIDGENNLSVNINSQGYIYD